MDSKPQKIAILGGGVGACVTAFELTSQPDWQQRYDITLYTLGWRMGGKGASGRQADDHERILEHGLHLWMGFYENAFRVIREAYQYCHDNNLMPGSPFQSYKDAFAPMNFVVVPEQHDGQWLPWEVLFPETDAWPGEPPASEGGYDYHSVLWNLLVDSLGRVLAYIEEVTDDSGPTPHGALRGRFLLRRGIQAALTPLREAFEHARGLDRNPRLHPADSLDVLRDLLDAAIGLLQKVVHLGQDLFDSNTTLRRFNTILDTSLAAIRGIVADRLVLNGFESIDHLEFRDWLASHGCRRPLNPTTTAFYDACFAYRRGQPDGNATNMAAGTMLYGLLRLVLSYRKSIMLWMEAGMGDTIFTPIYLALKHRGVKIEFYQKVTNLGLSADGKNVETIGIDVQATLKDPRTYDPLVIVKGLYCWPSVPRYEQLVEGEAIKSTPGNNNLESWWTAWKPVGQRTLRRGVDFDLVVNAISLGAVPFLCRELITADPRWRNMAERVETVRTQAFQLWLNQTASQLGWNPGPTQAPVMTGYLEPFDTWADLTHLIQREDWPPGVCKSIHYFCNAAPEDPNQPGFGDHDYPQRQTEIVAANAGEFLNVGMPLVWPRSSVNGKFDRRLVVGDFYRINIDPTELYVLSVAGSTEARLDPGDSGFANLYLAGDWTHVDINIGCVEAAVQSGMFAAHAISGSPRTFRGAYGIELPIAARGSSTTSGAGG